MRVVFLFFLLINAAYFYTQSDLFKDDQTPTILKEKKLPKGVERLTLLRERGLGVNTKPKKPVELDKIQESSEAEPEIQQAVEDIQSSPEVSKPAEKACFTLGPFVQASTAGRTAEAISALGVTVNRRQTTQRRPRGYWVYLPAFKTYDAARKKVRELQSKGLKDMFIMGKGEHKNAVSLGLYKTRSSADERFQQVKKMGLSVKLDTQYRETKLAWLDMEVAEDQTSTIASISELAGQNQKTTLTRHRCK
jgi:hypothetical protein